MKNNLKVQIKNALLDQGDGVVMFQGGLTLSDESEQANGTRYDMPSLDLSKYTGEVFVDHGGMLGYEVNKLVGTAINVHKEGDRLVADGVRFSQKNPEARLVHDLVLEGHARHVSIGTMGPEPDSNGVYRDHELSEWSFVGLGNNYNAMLNDSAMTVALNSLKQSEKDGLKVAPLIELFTNKLKSKGENMDEEEKKKLEEAKNAAEAKAKEAEEKIKNLQAQLDDQDDDEEEDKEEAKPDSAPSVDENSIKSIVENALKPIVEENAKLREAFDEGAKEPAWNINSAAPERAVKVNSREEAEKQFKNMDKWELAGLQYLSALNAQKGDPDAAKTLRAINEMNLENLKKEKVVPNVLTLGDFGNFVTSPELQAEVEGYRTDYSDALRAFTYTQTNSRDFSFLTRSGDIDLDDVDGVDDAVGTDNLKPVKEYSGTVTTSRLQEMAAVTPISTTANLFMAADLIQDATRGYRVAADKRFAQLPIARLEQAMEADATRSYSFDATGSDTNAVKVSNIRTAIFSISQGDGVLVMTEASLGRLWDLLTQLGASNALGESVVGDNPVRRLWGKNVVAVPNDLMPTLDDNTTYRSIPEVRPLAGGAPVTVTVNHAIFYLPLSTWKGRTNGGLRFDISSEASYESGGSVYSAFQRNEVLLRGHIFRGGAITDPSRVRGLRAENIIS